MINQVAFLLAQASPDVPVGLNSPAVQAGTKAINPQQASSLINLSAILLIGPIVLLLVCFAYVVIFSPVGAPLFKIMAESALKNKKYLQAARLYVKLHDMLELMEGTVYARKAAQSFELGGNLREAQDWYAKGEDWAKVGQLLMEAGQYAKALEIYKHHDLPARLAHCYEQLEDPLKAAEVYEKQLKNLHKAEMYYKKAAAFPDKEISLTAKLKLARVFLQLERLDEAQESMLEVSREIASSAQYQEFPELLQLLNDVKLLMET